MSFARILRVVKQPQRAVRAAFWHCYGRWAERLREARNTRNELHKPYPLVSGLGASPATSGRALLDFIVDPFVPGFSAKTSRSHSNHWVTTTIVDTLGAAGYAVDVTDWRNMHPPLADDYDLVLGQGRAFERSCKNLRREIPRIYFGWGLYAGATQCALAERVQHVKKHRGIMIHQTHPSDEGPRFATEVWSMGNEYVFETYRRIASVPVFELPNPIVDGVQPPRPGKDFQEARRHFMWMAAYGTLRRSLDVLLEVFEKTPDYHLWVCGGIEHEKSFFAAYRRELLELPNVHYVGWLDVAGDQYHEITHRCGYMLYPSISDGMPGSVVNAMAEGVIPILTDAAGMDCGGFGTRIPQIDHETIRQLIAEAAAIDPSDLARKSQEASRFAWKRYSKDAFRLAFRARLAATLARRDESVRQ